MEDDVNEAVVALPPVTPSFNELNPAIQAMVMLYLTGNIPHWTVITDERFRRSPMLNGSDKVEMVIEGTYDLAMLQTTVSVSVFINGVLTTPWSPWKEDPKDAT